MFQTLAIAILAIYLGEFLRKKIPAIKKYCIPAAVVGGTIFSIITCILYVTNVVAFSFDYSTMNTFFYNVFFAASGCAASLALLKKAASWFLSSRFSLLCLLHCRTPLHWALAPRWA